MSCCNQIFSKNENPNFERNKEEGLNTIKAADQLVE